MNIDDIKRRIDELINLAGQVIKTVSRSQYGLDVSSESFHEFRLASLSFLKTIFGTDHPFFKEFYDNANSADLDRTKKGLGILKAAKQEIEGG
jgi:hypothetical protein